MARREIERSARPEAAGAESWRKDADPPILPPRDKAEDALLTTILRAAELYERSRLSEAGTSETGVAHALPHRDAALAAAKLEPLVSLLRVIDELGARDPAIRTLLAAVEEAFGDGELIRVLVENLYPRPQLRPVLGEDGKPMLKEREAAVLAEAATGLSNEQIAQKLSISKRTVTTYLGRAYGKLGAHSLMEAVSRASLFGYIGTDGATAALRLLRHQVRGYSALRTFCAQVGDVKPPLSRNEIPPLAPLGMLLLAVGAAAARERRGDAANRSEERGGLCAIRPDGSVEGPYGADRMGIARFVVEVPESARGQGFTPRNLLVAHDLVPQCGLNRAAISEFEPSGRFVHSFAGGEDIATRLVGPITLAFTADGRLLVTSGWLTEGIVAFSDGGRKVERFAEGVFYQVAVGPDGTVYGASHDASHDGHICVIGSDGRVRDFFGRKPLGLQYIALAVDGRGWLYAVRRLRGQHTVDVYSAAGDLLTNIRLPQDSLDHITAASDGGIFLPCWDSESIVLTRNGGGESKSRRIPVCGRLAPTCVTDGCDHTIWAVGRVP